MLFRLFYFSLFLLLEVSVSNAQSASFYNYLKNDTVKQSQVLSQLADDYKIQRKAAKNKELRNFYLDRYTYLSETIQYDNFLFDDFFYPKLNEILTEIKKANSDLAIPTYEVLISRSPEPNAACYGNGYLVFNLGLFQHFKNEDQLAFVVAHEVAHDVFDHVNKRVEKRIAYRNSKEYKEAMKTIKSQEHNRLAILEAFLLEKGLSNRKYSRAKESQADSMAIALLENTSFSKNEALNALAVLDKVDEDTYKDSIPFNQVFTCQNQQFNPEWIVKSTRLNVQEKYDEALIDSLKTHPHCDDRIAYIKKFFEFETQKNELSEDFLAYRKKADYEVALYSLFTKNYTWGIKNLLTIPQYKEGDPFLNSLFSIFLGEIYFATKNHDIDGYRPVVRDEYSYNYRKTALLIKNIRLSELKKISLSYLEKLESNYTEEEISNNEHLLFASFLHARIKEDESLSESIKTNYINQYPKGIYKEKMNNL